MKHFFSPKAGTLWVGSIYSAKHRKLEFMERFMSRTECKPSSSGRLHTRQGRGSWQVCSRGGVSVQMAKEQSCTPQKSLLLRAWALIPQLGHHSCSLSAQKEPQAEAVISTTTPGGNKPNHWPANSTRRINDNIYETFSLSTLQILSQFFSKDALYHILSHSVTVKLEVYYRLTDVNVRDNTTTIGHQLCK